MAVQDLYVLSGYWAPDYAFGDEGVYPISELQGVAPSAIIELFELDLNQLQHGITETYRFHAGSSLNANGELVWAGNNYLRFPVEADGFEYSGNGQLPRPKIRCSNILGTITALLLSLPSGLEGAKFTRIRTLARYLDEANFPPRRNLYNDTNLFAWTESATSAGPQVRWRQPNAALAPDDTLTATKLSVSTDSDDQRILVGSTGIAANTVVTFSVYAKSAEYSRIGIRATSPTTTTAVFNLQTGEWLVNSDATSQFAVYAGAGWWRIGITYTTTTGNPANWIRIVSNNNFFTFTGDGTSGIYIWGAQLEANPSATEYQYIGSTWTRSPYGVPDPSAEFPREIFYVDRKVVETRDVVEFELAAAFDLAGVRAPKRQCISNICQWVYRSAECGYTAPLYFDEDDALETTAAADVCGKRLSSCQVRFSSYTRTGSVTSGSTTITLTPPTSLSAGTPITGHGIPAGTVTVGTVLDGTTFTLSQAANANTTATKLCAVQSNRTSMAVSNVVGLTLGMAVSGAYIPAGTTITGIAGNTVSLSQPAPINFQVAFTRPNINIYPVAGQTAYSHLYVINTAGISVGMAVTGPGLPSDLSARVTGLTTISFLGVAIVSYAVARQANGTYTFYASTAYASASYTFTGSTTYAIRGASDSLPFGSFPGVGTYYA